MKLLNTEVLHIDGKQRTIRLSGTIQMDRGRQHVVWVEVPEEYGDFLSRDGNCWLILMTLLGALAGEDVRVDAPVDPLLLSAMPAIVAIWKTWYRGLYIPKIDVVCPIISIMPQRDISASFFSGGIDSLFTAVRHGRIPDRATGAFFASDLLVRNLHVEQLSEIGIDSPEITAFKTFCGAVGKRLLPLSSNIMVFSERIHDRWTPLAHGAALAFLAHALGNKISMVLIASSHTFQDLIPWGSHPLTDPLFSSSTLQIIHDGALFSRYSKTAYIAKNPPARQIINVCDNTAYDKTGLRNCSRCQKCLRTMTALDLLGFRNAADTSFNWGRYTSASFGTLFLKNQNEVNYADDLIQSARELGRSDVAESIGRAMIRSKQFRPLERLFDYSRTFDIVLNHKPMLKRQRDRLLEALGLKRRV